MTCHISLADCIILALPKDTHPHACTHKREHTRTSDREINDEIATQTQRQADKEEHEYAQIRHTHMLRVEH